MERMVLLIVCACSQKNPMFATMDVAPVCLTKVRYNAVWLGCILISGIAPSIRTESASQRPKNLPGFAGYFTFTRRVTYVADCHISGFTALGPAKWMPNIVCQYKECPRCVSVCASFVSDCPLWMNECPYCDVDCPLCHQLMDAR